MTSQCKTGGRRMARAQLRARAVELRREGRTQRDIAAELRIAQSTVHDLLTEALEHWREKESKDVETIVAVEIDRLDALHRAVWPDAMEGKLGAIDRCLAISKRRAELLGLDAPSKHEVTGKDGEPFAPPHVTEDQLRRMAEEILAGGEPLTIPLLEATL